MLEWTRQGVSGEEGGVLIVDQTVWWVPEWTWRWVGKFLKLPRKQTKNIINKTNCPPCPSP